MSWKELAASANRARSIQYHLNVDRYKNDITVVIYCGNKWYNCGTSNNKEGYSVVGHNVG